MHKIYTRLFTIFLSVCTIICSSNIVVSAEEDINEYSETLNFLQSIGAFKGVEYTSDRILTRAEFAELLVRAVNYESYLENDVKSEKVDVDTSYLNEKGWMWIGDADNEDKKQSNTKFSDVTIDMKEYNSICFAVDLNFMVTDGNKFKPYENITGNEVMRAVDELLNLKTVRTNLTAEEYTSIAYFNGIGNGVVEKDMSRPLRMSDISKIFANAMKTEPYVRNRNGNNTTYEQKQNYYLMSHLFGVYYNKGTVSANRYASLSGYSCTANINEININDTDYVIDGDFDGLLGRKLEVYYIANDDNRIVYYNDITADDAEITLQSDDIISFENHVLSYYDGNKVKQAAVTSESTVVYNGAEINSYEDEDFNIKSGNIVLQKTGNENRYSLVKITKYNTMAVSSVDYTEKIIYGDNGDILTMSVKDYPDIKFVMPDKTEVIFDTIAIDNILSIALTKAGKQEERCTVVISSDTVSGKLGSYNLSDHTVSIGGKEYKYISDFFDPLKFPVASRFIGYLNSEGRIVTGKGSMEINAKYGYLKNICQDEMNDEYYLIRIFEQNAKFKSYPIKKKIKFNGKSIKPKSLYNELTDSNGATIYQVLQYWVDDEGNISSICTADGMDGAFSKYDISKLSVSEVTYRNGGLLSYANNGFAAFMNTNGGFVSFAIPEDKTNESLYGCVAKFVNEQKYVFDELYKKSAESNYIDVCVQLGVTAKKEFSSDGATPYMMVSKIISCSDEDDQPYYLICGINTTTNVEYKCYDEDLFEQCKALHKGDVLRLNINSMSNEVEYIKKFFDADKRTMVEGKTKYGDILHPYEAMNVYAVDATDSYQFLVSNQYIYTSGNLDGDIPDLDATKAAYTKDGTRIFKYPTRIVCYDSKRDVVSVGSKQDVVYSEDPYLGSMLLVCSYYENAQIMFVIK